VINAILPSTEDVTPVLSTKLHGVTSQRATFSYSYLTHIILREAGKNCSVWRFIKRAVVAMVIQSVLLLRWLYKADVMDVLVECMGSSRNACRILIRKREKTGNLGDLHIARKVISKWL
jgi:hypothetical protein